MCSAWRMRVCVCLCVSVFVSVCVFVCVRARAYVCMWSVRVPVGLFWHVSIVNRRRTRVRICYCCVDIH